MVAYAEKQNTEFKSDLNETLALFQNLSEKLTASYQELEGRVTELQGELEETDTALSQEVSDKKKLETRVDSILSAMPVGVVILDGAGEVTEANGAARNILGDPLEGQSWISIIHRCFSPTMADGHEISLKNGRFVSLATQSIANEPGQIIVINDLTETRALQKKVNHNLKLSEMGKMTASLAHQIRTPLSTALLYADHLSGKTLDKERQQRYAGKLKDRLLQLESQVNDMLIFSKGGIVIENKVDVNWFLQELVRRYSDLAHQQGVVLAAQPFTTPISLKCNVDLLTSAYGNLIENALHALSCQSDDTVSVKKVSLAAKLDRHGRIIIAVLDNGGGIDEEILNNVWEPFFTTKSTGTGLGLAVVNLIAKSHGAEHKIKNRMDENGQVMGLSIAIAFPVVTDVVPENVLNIHKNTNVSGGTIQKVAPAIAVG